VGGLDLEASDSSWLRLAVGDRWPEQALLGRGLKALGMLAVAFAGSRTQWAKLRSGPSRGIEEATGKRRGA